MRIGLEDKGVKQRTVPNKAGNYLFCRCRLFLRRKAFLVLLLPALIIYLTFVVYPFLNSLRMSLYEWSGIGAMKFVGLANFKRLLFVAPYQNDFFNALKHNGFFFMLSLVMKIVCGLLVSLILAQKLKGASFFRGIYFIPITLSMTVVGYLWGLLLNPQWGIVNRLLALLGLGKFALSWLGDPNTALPTIVGVHAWRSTGFVVVILHAAILSIPSELSDTAQIDGANRFHYAWRIILPLLLPTILTVTTLEFIWSMDVFDIIYALAGTAGGPYHSTDVLGLLFYRTAFGGFGGSATEMGMGAAIAVLMFIIILPISLAITSIRRRTETPY